METEEVKEDEIKEIVEKIKQIIDDIELPEDIEKKDTFLIGILVVAIGLILWYIINWYNNSKRKKVNLIYRE